jgi:hypothetical protein
MAGGGRTVEGRWRIVETDVWDQEALDFVVPAHITLGPDGLGEMQLIAIGASIDYRVNTTQGGPLVRFSWSGFDDMDPSCGRGWAKVRGDAMRGKLFIHQGDESRFKAIREVSGGRTSGSGKAERARRRTKP